MSDEKARWPADVDNVVIENCTAISTSWSGILYGGSLGCEIRDCKVMWSPCEYCGSSRVDSTNNCECCGVPPPGFYIR